MGHGGAAGVQRLVQGMLKHLSDNQGGDVAHGSRSLNPVVLRKVVLTAQAFSGARRRLSRAAGTPSDSASAPFLRGHQNLAVPLRVREVIEGRADPF